MPNKTNSFMGTVKIICLFFLLLVFTTGVSITVTTTDETTEPLAIAQAEIKTLKEKNDTLEKEIAILNAKRMADPMNTVWEDAAFSNAQMRLCP